MAGHYSDRHRHGVLSFLVFWDGGVPSQDIDAEKDHGLPSPGMSSTVSFLFSNGIHKGNLINTWLFSTRLIPLAGVRLHYITAQITSATPILTGAFATVTTEMYLAISVLCLVSAFLKSFLAVYEDSNGISYTDGMSGSHSKSRKGSSNTLTPRNQSRFSTTVEGLRGWEREEDPIIIPTNASGGLQIYKSVQVDVSDEPIELTEAGRAKT